MLQNLNLAIFRALMKSWLKQTRALVVGWYSGSDTKALKNCQAHSNGREKMFEDFLKPFILEYLDICLLADINLLMFVKWQ